MPMPLPLPLLISVCLLGYAVGHGHGQRHGQGLSLFWSQWAGNWYTAATVESLADQWGCTLVRAAMGIESGGYLTNPAAEKAKVKTLVDAAIAKGIYIIKLSWANWSLFDKKETASAVKPGSSPKGPWGKDDLTPSGLFVTRYFPMPGAKGSVS